MSWSIKVSSIAEKYFKKLDKKRRRKIKEKLLALSRQQNPLENIQVKALTGELKGFYRLRVGDYRIIFLKITHSLLSLVNKPAKEVLKRIPRDEAARKIRHNFWPSSLPLGR